MTVRDFLIGAAVAAFALAALALAFAVRATVRRPHSCERGHVHRV